MAFHLDTASLQAAIKHLCRYGDTDIFPHLPEISFIADQQDAIVDELTKLDLDSYAPSGAIEALAPKSRFAFRIAHQLSALDTLLLLACVVQIGNSIEAKRNAGKRAFSYRFFVDADSGQLFRSDRTYKDWLHYQRDILVKNRKVRTVVITDISDYYSRINFHRLENLLDEAAPSHGAARFIKKHIKIIRAKQSFGLPVGGAAARVLAELALSDIDRALQDRGVLATRFVDDFRLFLLKADSPYDALGYLAEHLGINEGLSLNAAKTRVVRRGEYLRTLDRLTSDVAEEAEGVALESLAADLYFDEEPDQDELQKLKAINLVELLENELEADNLDVGRIKVIFRALKIAKPNEVIEFINKRFDDMIIFSKEVCLLMEQIESDEPQCFDGLLRQVTKAILDPPASSVQLIRTWLLEIFVRNIIEISRAELKAIENLPAITDKRQLLLIRGRLPDVNYFRRQKTAVHNFSEFELPCLAWGASCLPKDEYEKWIDTVKDSFRKPLGRQFLRWLTSNREDLLSKLSGIPIAEHPE